MNDLNTLMHARVDDERPDLDRLLTGAVHDGHRIRRRRTIGYAGAGLVAGVVAGATIGAVTLFGGPHATELTPAAHDTASSPRSTPGSGSAPTLRAGQVVQVTRNIRGEIVANGQLPRGAAIQASNSMLHGVGDGFTVVLTGPYQAVQRLWADGFVPLFADYPGIQIATSAADTPQPVSRGHAIAFALKGWSCPPPRDDKTICTGPDGATAEVTWRPADSYADWTGGSSDKQATWVSTVHDGVFVAIDGPAAVELGHSLLWK